MTSIIGMVAAALLSFFLGSRWVRSPSLQTQPVPARVRRIIDPREYRNN
jgi:hypothetical protein